jgi:hypothetical protein
MVVCQKVAYSNRWSAQRALAAVRDKQARRDRKLPTGTYWCSTCRAWHLTSKSPSRPVPWQKERDESRPQTGESRSQQNGAC